MKILYLDTSSSFLYAGIVDNDKLLHATNKKFDKDLSTYALNEIRELFNKCDMTPQDVDKIIVVNGPGSFTGIRIGLTIAKTLAWTLNKSISVISSLEAMALSNRPHNYYIPLIDARRENVYAGIYDENYNQILKNQHIRLNDLLEKVQKMNGSKCFISNDIFDFEVQPYVPDILKIVNFYKDKPSINPHGIDANYLKLTEAEENKNQNQQVNNDH